MSFIKTVDASGAHGHRGIWHARRDRRASMHQRAEKAASRTFKRTNGTGRSLIAVPSFQHLLEPHQDSNDVFDSYFTNR
jgi:hypothetical protein